MLSDGLFKVRIQKTIKIQSQTTKAPIYFYNYQFPAEFGIGHMLSKKDMNWGVAHGDDIFTVFSSPLRNSEKNPFSEEEYDMQNRLLDFYETFLNDG